MSTKFDFEKVATALLDRGEPFHLFGGEPLLLALDDIERLFAFNHVTFGTGGGIQTNGVLITDRHIDIFKRYNVKVGVSIDGPGELNDARWAGSLEKTREATRASLHAIELLVSANLRPTLMVQLTRCNASQQRLPILCEWLTEMDRIGIDWGRIHILEHDLASVREAYGLTVPENVAALTTLTGLATRFQNLRLDVASDKKQLLAMQDSNIACTYRACDPLVTPAVAGLSGDGAAHKCGLTDREGVNFLRTDNESYERYVALYLTPQQYGGCNGCRFFAACKGQCPGAAIDGDWRNRSENCEVWRQLFIVAETELMAEGILPLSRHPSRSAIEAALLKGWMAGHNLSLAEVRLALAIDTDRPVAQ